MTRRVKVTGDLFHGQVPDGAVYVGRQAPRTLQIPVRQPISGENLRAHRIPTPLPPGVEIAPGRSFKIPSRPKGGNRS
jgi:hypothetical protein